MSQQPTTKLKAIIYGVNARGLLVFKEPDFPQIPYLVPGGSVEADEDLELAAQREFEEETGLSGFPLVKFFEYIHDWPHTKASQTRFHHRHCFTCRLPDSLPDTWDHYEEHASDGSPPILFRFEWMALEQARSKLGWGFAAALDHL